MNAVGKPNWEDLSDTDRENWISDNIIEQDVNYHVEDMVEHYLKDNQDQDVEKKSNAVDEWWSVSSWLADQLLELGEIVVEIHSTHCWGRRTTKRAIALDAVIEEIAKKVYATRPG